MSRRLRILVWVNICLWMAPTAWAQCPSRQSDVDPRAEQAIAAFANMDVTGFRATREHVRTLLSCLEEPIDPERAAAWHRIEGLAAFLERDTDRALAAFRASRAAAPDGALPVEIAPPGHVIDKLFQGATAQPGEGTPLVPPIGTHVVIDGAKSSALAVNQPAIVQLVTSDDRVVWSRYVDPTDPTPDWSQVVVSVPAPAPEPVTALQPVAQRQIVNLPLLASAGVVGATSAGLFLAARAGEARFDDPTTPFDELDALRGRTNTLSGASQVGAVLAVGLGVASFTVRF